MKNNFPYLALILSWISFFISSWPALIVVSTAVEFLHFVLAGAHLRYVADYQGLI
jgi:hypothetical protein